MKGARFVRFCDAFNIPIITFVDVPGFLPGIPFRLFIHDPFFPDAAKVKKKKKRSEIRRINQDCKSDPLIIIVSFVAKIKKKKGFS